MMNKAVYYSMHLYCSVCEKTYPIEGLDYQCACGGLFKLHKEEKEKNDAQVIEYALIIAVISIALVVALQPLLLAGSFGAFIGRTATCLTTAACA